MWQEGIVASPPTRPVQDSEQNAHIRATSKRDSSPRRSGTCGRLWTGSTNFTWANSASGASVARFVLILLRAPDHPPSQIRAGARSVAHFRQPSLQASIPACASSTPAAYAAFSWKLGNLEAHNPHSCGGRRQVSHGLSPVPVHFPKAFNLLEERPLNRLQ